MKRLWLTLLLATAVACAGLTAVAIAHTVRYPTTVSIKVKTRGHKPDTFEGKVTAATPRCVIGRTVKVKMSTMPTRIGTATTDASGNWSLQLAGDAQPGDYFAIATKTVLRRNTKHVHVCKAGRSSTVTVK